MASSLEELKYFFYSLEFKPFAKTRDTHNSHAIGKEVFFELANIKKQGKALLIDRFENSDKKSSRELFISNATIIHADRKVRLTIALIRKSRKPKVKKKNSFHIEDLDVLGDIVEVTHFFYDFSTSQNVICVERNSNGPNIKDIEYYLKSVARDKLELARTADLTIHMKDTIENTITRMKNVLSFNIKIRPSNISLMDKRLADNYFSGFDIVSSMYKPQFLRFEAFFKRQGRKKNEERAKNKIATSMFSDALSIFNKKPEETEYFEQFDVVYEDGKGLEDTFNLLNDKMVVVKYVESDDITLKESYNLIEKDFSDFVNSLQ